MPAIQPPFWLSDLMGWTQSSTRRAGQKLPWRRSSLWKLLIIFTTLSITCAVFAFSRLNPYITAGYGYRTLGVNQGRWGGMPSQQVYSGAGGGGMASQVVVKPPGERPVWTSKEAPATLEFLKDLQPLSTYFNERLAGSVPSGTGHISPHMEVTGVPLKLVLVFTPDLASPELYVIGQFFTQQKIEYRATKITDPVPALVMQDLNRPKYSLIVFEDYASYLNMDPNKKAIIDDYCKTYTVGIFATSQSQKTEQETFPNHNLKIQHKLSLRQLKLNPASSVWDVAKPKAVFNDKLPTEDWTAFIPDHVSYTPLAFSTFDPGLGGVTGGEIKEFDHIVAIHDAGLIDGIEKIILGYSVGFWLFDIVGTDAIAHLSHGRLRMGLERYLQVDIDDVFVGKTGIRTKAKDVDAMIASQNKIATSSPGFKWVCGFSGYSYQKGDEEENKGDERFMELSDNFVWFDHMYQHIQAHKINKSHIMAESKNNFEFAKSKKMKVQKEYSVVPHHSGVYPVFEDLFSAWQEIGVKATSTEEYPHYMPSSGRRGFIYRDVMVLPRQICNLFTTIIKFEHYAGGKEGLDANIRGGELFRTILHTPIMVFMTHMSNYAADRLALYMFEEAVQFVSTWTNLKLSSPPPMEIADKYFDMYPHETLPLWTNPCDDKRHMDIWPAWKSCSAFPKFIIVGPQKTGTTALHSFLETHPNIQCSKKDPVHFEEIQFFNHDNYLYGLDWYQGHFEASTDPLLVQFEKSANYFDSQESPRRIAALLPDVKIIIISIDPAKRAYSWYQHMKSHNDPACTNHSFHEIMTSGEDAPKEVKEMRNRCLRPGQYAIHLARYLQYFPKNQIYFVDGDQLTQDPITLLNDLQKFLEIKAFVDYGTKIRFDAEKGFYCSIEKGCLSASKGRKYPPMEPETAQYLSAYFKEHNENLRTILTDIGHQHPQWLIKANS